MGFWTRDTIDINQMLQRVRGPGHGATALFVGTVRSGPDDGPVERIEYSAYEAMLDTEFGRILEEAGGQWPDVTIDALHRLGSIPTGEASIAVVVGAPHRSEAFAACRYVIEEVKTRLPVWKKEILVDGRAWWRPNRTDASPPEDTTADAVSQSPS